MVDARARIFTILALAAVGAVNVAGLWGIAVARRGALEEAERLSGVETSVRARGLESLLSTTRADLAFLAGSPPVARLEAARVGTSADEASFRRQAAEAALLLFLRGHPEVTRLVVLGRRGEPLVLTGRRGGVPVLWVSANPTGAEGAAIAPSRQRLKTLVAFGPAAGGEASAPSLEAELAPALLLGPEPGAEPGRRCRLADASGTLIAETAGRPRTAGEGRLRPAAARVAADGWSAPSPWQLTCTQPEAALATLDASVAGRYRGTLIFNLAAMLLALALASFAVREVRTRERLEAQSREDARVRELERQLFHAERLTTVGRLAAGIAHEINNPLEGMANYLSLARDAIERGDKDAARRRLAGVAEGLERAASIVRQVLAHADPAKADKSPVDVNRVLADTTEFVRSRREFMAIRFETALAPGPLVVEGSPSLLGQVAANLMINACEAQPQGGEVQVSSRRDGERVIVEVADRGPGLRAADLERIFEPFFSTKDSTGLGLSICHTIVRQHGGELVALPREGGGALFRVSLPGSGTRTEAA